MAAIRFYLRPVADVRVDHSLDTTTAESGVGGFAALNEEVKDSGYISATRAKEDKEWYSIFRLGGSVPTDEEFTSMKFCVHFGDVGSMLTATIGSIGDESFGITVNGQTEYVGGSKDKMGLVTFELSSSLTAVKNYLAANGTFPPIEIIIYTWMSGYGDDKSFAYRYYYQAYIELSTEMGIHHKVSGDWATSGKAYERINGSWKKISKDATKSILTSRLLKSGHEAIAIAGYNPTCTSEGLSTGYKCNKCGKEFISQVVIPALGHSPVTIAGYAATCATAGLTNGSKCTRCGATLVPQEVIPATGNHEFITNNLHTVCGTCGQIKDRGFVSLSQYGTATDLSVARYYLAGTSVGGYALFAGGAYIGNSYNTVDAYNASLTRSIPTALSISREQLAATTIGGYALFAGGDTGAAIDSSCVTVDAYNTSLTRTNVTALSQARSELAGTSVGGYALFAGGITDGASGSSCVTVDAYNTSLTRSIPTALSQSRCGLAATTVGNFALFGGGLTSSSGGAADRKNHVDAYDASLTRTNPSGLSIYGLTAAATAGFYAVFAGGYDSTSVGGYTSSTVNAYNRSLTRTSPTSLSHHRDRIAATSVANYAIFGGGRHSGGFGDIDNSSAVDVYNHSLTRSNPGSLSEARMNLAAAVVGDYALFAGGDDKTSRVDVYKIS